jgi:peptidoglycan hydrolase-like protein with peptidoglycan-binding domain
MFYSIFLGAALSAVLVAAPVKKVPNTKPATKTNSASRSGSGAARSKKSARPVARRTFQAEPTQARYREIQGALAQRGHYKEEVNGAWGPESVEALKQFQQEQSLTPSGKIDSVSLIALGLGPKRNLVANGSNTGVPRPPDDNRRSQGSERP